MIYLLSAILVGFGAWYAYHVYQKVTYKRKVEEAVRLREKECARKNTPEEERVYQSILNNTYDFKHTPPGQRYARMYTQETTYRRNDTSASDYLATILIADAIISTPDTSDSFSGGGGDFGGGGASGNWNSDSDTSSNSSYDSGSSSSYDSGGGSDSGSFGGSD